MPPSATPRRTPARSRKTRSSALGLFSDGKTKRKAGSSIFDTPSALSTPSSTSRKTPRGSHKRRHPVSERARLKKLDALSKFLKLIPFSPGNSLDLSAHESLLRHIGLWDFAHLNFDTQLHENSLKILIANFTKDSRVSSVDGIRIEVNCAALRRAMKLPVRIKSSSANIIEITKDEISFLERFVSEWFLLHGEMWIMPEEILHWMNLIKEGNIWQIDWAKVLWFMMEKELSASELHQCFYASHIQYLIKHQKPELLEEHPEKDAILDAGDDGDLVVEESQPIIPVADLSKSDSFNVEKDEAKEDADNNSKVECEEEKMFIEERQGNIANEDNSADIEIETEILQEGGVKEFEKTNGFNEAKVEVECKNEMLTTSIMGRCKLVETSHNEDERKHHEAIEMEELVEEEDDEDLMDEEENEEGDLGLSMLSQRQQFEGVCTGFPSGLHIPEGNFLISGVDSDRYPNHSRNDGMWQGKAPSEMDMWFDQMSQMMQKCKAMYSAKEQACHELTMNQQLYLAELQQRDNVIQRQKEELQKKHVESYRLENELYMMSNLVEGYSKALKRVQSSFAEYREQYSLAKESVYRDTGCGGLVLSKVEIEKQRLRKEEEEKQTLLVLEAQIKLFETEFVSGFKHYEDQLQMLTKKLDFVRDAWCFVKDSLASTEDRPTIGEE